MYKYTFTMSDGHDYNMISQFDWPTVQKQLLSNYFLTAKHRDGKSVSIATDQIVAVQVVEVE